MGIFNRKRNISEGGRGSSLDKKQHLSKDNEKSSIFGERRHLTRSQFRQGLRKASPSIPGTSKIVSRSERIKMEKDLFGKSYGSFIDKREFGKAIGRLEKQKYQSKKSSEKRNLDRKIEYLKKLRGI